jgi:hypothetical protein
MAVEKMPVVGPVVRFLLTSAKPWTVFWRDVFLLGLTAVVFFHPVAYRERRPREAARAPA